MSGQAGRHKAVDVAVAEFNALRSEISARTSAQVTIATLGLTSTGVVLGFAFGGDADGRIVLAVPYITAVTLVAYAGEAARIQALGSYIRHELWPFVEVCLGADLEGRTLPSWETCKTDRLRLDRRPLSGGAPIGVLLYAVGVLAALLAPGTAVWLRTLSAVAVTVAAAVAVLLVVVVARTAPVDRPPPVGRGGPVAPGSGPVGPADGA